MEQILKRIGEIEIEQILALNSEVPLAEAKRLYLERERLINKLMHIQLQEQCQGIIERMAFIKEEKA